VEVVVVGEEEEVLLLEKIVSRYRYLLHKC
jgi:hypothetical protein